ncbi:MAG: hypothetical protein SynsKO_37650 [Synoicihabitans sp.]
MSLAKPPSSTSSRSARFKSPMPQWDDTLGPKFIPFWQTALAGLAAIASVAFAILLYSKL